MATESISDAIEKAAKGPARVTIDGNTVESHPIPDLIAADQYATRKAAVARKGLPIRIAKIVPGGTV